MPKKLKDIAKLINGELIGDGEVLISGVNGINEAREDELAFILKPEYAPLIDKTRAAGVIVPKETTGTFNKPLIKIDNASSVFSKIIELLMPDRIPRPKGISTNASISSKAKLSKDVSVGPYVFIEAGASIGNKTVIYPFCYIGKNVRIGSSCILYPNVTVREEVVLGDRVIIHPGTVIGSDGFGYDTQKDGTHYKIPQLGTVIIEDDVELGACVAVDRARFNRTIIGKGSKIDNLCQIAHNVIIGPNCLIAGQSGISGSCELGRNVVLGGQVGLSDHIKLGDFVMAGAKTGISKSFPARTTLFWYPARPVDKAREVIASVGLLPKLYARVRELESKIKAIEKK